MKIYIGSDHGGFSMKSSLIPFINSTLNFWIDEFNKESRKLRRKKFDSIDGVIDCGCYTEDPVDYPDVAKSLIDKMWGKKDSLGILICGTGIGMSIIANRYENIRAALCHTMEDAQLSRQHNNANILVLPGRFMDIELAKMVVKNFVMTDFSNDERHIRRIEKIDKEDEPSI